VTVTVAITLGIKTWRLLLDDLFHAAYQHYAPPRGWSGDDYAIQKKVMFDSMAAVGQQKGKTRSLTVHGWLIMLEEIDRLRRWKGMNPDRIAAAGLFSAEIMSAKEMATVLYIDRRVKQAEAAVLNMEQALRVAEAAVARARKAVYLDGAEEAEEGEAEEGGEAADSSDAAGA